MKTERLVGASDNLKTRLSNGKIKVTLLSHVEEMALDFFHLKLLSPLPPPLLSPF